MVVGDGTVGKTCLLTVYKGEEFPRDYIPTVFENQTKTVLFNDEKVELALWDTAGQEEYARLRPLSYPRSDAFLICFSVDNDSSLNNVKEHWVPEIRNYNTEGILILVGTKSDLRVGEKSSSCVNQTKCESVAKEIEAYSYLECSSLRNDNVQAVFEAALTGIEAKSKKKKRKRACTIL